MAKIDSVDAYIKLFDGETQTILQKIRKTIKTIAPKAEECIAYGMPAYKFHKKPLVYFAAYEKHIGFYATPNGHKAFVKELSKYKQGKGSVQFPLDEPIPYKLIAEITAWRMEETSKSQQEKNKK